MNFSNNQTARYKSFQNTISCLYYFSTWVLKSAQHATTLVQPELVTQVHRTVFTFPSPFSQAFHQQQIYTLAALLRIPFPSMFIIHCLQFLLLHSYYATPEYFILLYSIPLPLIAIFSSLRAHKKLQLSQPSRSTTPALPPSGHNTAGASSSHRNVRLRSNMTLAG